MKWLHGEGGSHSNRLAFIATLKIYVYFWPTVRLFQLCCMCMPVTISFIWITDQSSDPTAKASILKIYLKVLLISNLVWIIQFDLITMKINAQAIYFYKALWQSVYDILRPQGFSPLLIFFFKINCRQQQ